MPTCPECEAEFSETTGYCPACEVELFPERKTDEIPDLAVLCTVLDENKAHIIRGFLENEGIPCQLENISFHAEPAPVADLMKVRLWTLRDDVKRAISLLEECEQNQICPNCNELYIGSEKLCLQCRTLLKKTEKK